MKKIILITCCVLNLMACKDEPRIQKGIDLTDPTNIVTESDSAYLGNTTQDISPTTKKSAESQIATMMVEVDSVHSTQKLAEAIEIDGSIAGLQIAFSECDVVFENMTAHLTNKSIDVKKVNEITYKKDGGDILEMLFQVNGLTQVGVEQRITTCLTIEQEGERYSLDDLGKVTTAWFNLAGKDSKFISLGMNSLQFKEVNQKAIKNALNHALQIKNKNATQIKTWMTRISNTKSHTDAPCKLIISSSEWRIIGFKEGKKIQKTIRIEN
jgi:hypothetical protein